VQFLYCTLRFLNGLHLNESKALGALIVAIAHDLCVLDVANAVEELEEIALGRIEGQIADVKTRRSNFDRLRFTLRAWFAFALFLRPRLMLLLAVTRLRRWFPLAAVASKKCDDALPKCFLLRCLRAFALILKTTAPAPTSRPAASVTLASPV
jgi:hypothetical protein